MFEQCLRYRAQSAPDAIAMETMRGPVTYAQLHDAGRRIELALRAAGVAYGQTVLVSDSRPVVHWSVLFALESIGCVSVSEDARGNAARTLVFDAVFSERDPAPDSAPVKIHATQDWVDAALADEAAALPARTVPRTPADIVRILLTSGTTGDVKHVPFTRAMMDAHILTLSVDTLRPKARMLSTMGIDSLGGYLVSHGVWNSGGCMLYGAAPAEALATLRPDFMLMAPIQLQYLLAALPEDAPRRDDLRIAVGGSNLPRRLHAETVRRLTGDVVIGYGSTEAGYVTGGPASMASDQPGATGYMLPGSELQIVGPDGEPLPAGEIGRVRVRTTGMAPGYLHGPSGGLSGDGWFYPGDLGWLRRDGLFVLEGRDDDVLNIGGVKVSAWSVEEALLADDTVLEAAAFTLPDADGVPSLHAAVVIRPGTALGDVATAAATRTSHALKLVGVAALPRNPMGKVLRAELREGVAAAMRGNTR